MIAAPAGRASVTIGSDLAPSPATPVQTCACTLLQTDLPGAQLTSPVNGTVVRWRVNMAGGALLAGIRVVRLLGASRIFFAGESLASVPSGGATIPASLPISAGDGVALDISGTVAGNSTTPGASGDQWTPRPGAGTAPPASAPITDEVYYNADVEPSNTFTVSTPVLDRKTGSATVDVGLPNVGNVTADATRVKVAGRRGASRAKKKRRKTKPLISSFDATSVGPGTVTLKLESSKPVHDLLLAKGRAKGIVSITYAPHFGVPSTQSLDLKLRLKSKRR